MLQPKLVKVEPLPQMKLRLSYETGEIKVFDVEPYAMGSWFSKLKDDNYFKTVQMLPGGIGIEWPEGQDIAPHELYENSIAVKKTPDKFGKRKELDFQGQRIVNGKAPTS